MLRHSILNRTGVWCVEVNEDCMEGLLHDADRVYGGRPVEATYDALIIGSCISISILVLLFVTFAFCTRGFGIGKAGKLLPKVVIEMPAKTEMKLTPSEKELVNKKRNQPAQKA